VRKHCKSEQIVGRPQDEELLYGHWMSMVNAIRRLGDSKVTLNRWHIE
jgi:hypothetical protein